MICYLIVARNVTTEAMESLFPGAVYALAEGPAWVIGTELSTSSDVCKALEMGDELGRGGIVVKIGEYYGFYDNSLWQKIDAWRQA